MKDGMHRMRVDGVTKRVTADERDRLLEERRREATRTTCAWPDRYSDALDVIEKLFTIAPADWSRDIDHPQFLPWSDAQQILLRAGRPDPARRKINHAGEVYD
jgi:hypothetical protein